MKNQRRSRQHGRRVWQGVILVLAGFATVAAVTFALQSRGGADDASAPRQISPNGAAANAVPSGPVSVAGLEVGERLADLGRVSLNTPVRREWVLKNRGTMVVTLAQPTIEVLEGCWPTDPVVGSTTIAPGQETPLILDLPMGMHAGMEGPHLFKITVLARNESGETGPLELYFKANFR